MRVNEIELHSAVLVVVHPGSLCGSLAMYHSEECEDIRDRIAHEIETFEGPVITVLGGMEDEFDDPFDQSTRDLGLALDSCSEWEVNGEPSERGLRNAAIAIARHYPAQQYLVTGAWHDQDGQGCVTSVANGLKVSIPQAVVQISPNAPASD